jgi:Mn-dependent DtxR family transcriptional regulator
MNERALYMGYRISKTQLDVLRFVIEYAKDHNGNSPGVAEIAAHFEVAWSTARWHLGELSNKRLVELRDSKIVVEDANWEPPDLLE